MNLLDTHSHRLVFRLAEHAPEKQVRKWNELKTRCESGDNKQIIEQMKQYCKLEINRNMPYLEREEGGLGGNDNKIHKQIRLRHVSMGQQFDEGLVRHRTEHTNIVFNEITSTGIEKWTYNELDDLIYAFIRMANYSVGANCVSGHIELTDLPQLLAEDYLASDNE